MNDSEQAIMKILHANFAEPQFISLLETHLSDMQRHSPKGSVYALDLSELTATTMSMFALWENDVLIGIGGLKKLSDHHAEIKSMRTHPNHIRKGVAQRLLQHIIEQAKAQKIRLLSLETGSGPAFEPAVRLYNKYGFRQGAGFSDYVDSPFNQFFHLALE